MSVQCLKTKELVNIGEQSDSIANHFATHFENGVFTEGMSEVLQSHTFLLFHLFVIFVVVSALVAIVRIRA